MKPISLTALALAALAGNSLAQAPGFVAGLHPDRRPDGAPQITQQVASPEALARSLRGVEGPPPGNVESIAATGAHWVPLRGPGMTPPYDPRNWHAQPAAQGAAAGASGTAAAAPASAAK
ncbi:hypothetical protein [Ottowia testudinis]|uniref:Uncharacterized protein n=1 Tax=Ottowia testudinis TaxID=2816950 RepID=A0A975CG02_9BURK|nr:hypothetical protein [Ottowia testudinis]QTD45102.1 hypothetical protein J1M35_19090 [Ottowia testudinis]